MSVPFVVAVLVLALVLRSPVLGVVAVLLVAVLVLARVWVRSIRAQLRVRHQHRTRSRSAKTRSSTLKSKNHALLPIPWLEVRESVPLALRTVGRAAHRSDLGAGATHRATYQLKRSGVVGIASARCSCGWAM
jgi:hypothetical protein